MDINWLPAICILVALVAFASLCLAVWNYPYVFRRPASSWKGPKEWEKKDRAREARARAHPGIAWGEAPIARSEQPADEPPSE